MTKKYNPLNHSVVQACLKADGWQNFEADDFVEALVYGLKTELDRAYWNWHQEILDNRKDWQLLDIGEGFEYRRYYWGDEEHECSLPNLAFREVRINWYKHIGRGMSVNVDWDANRWRVWFDEAMKVIRLYDCCMQLNHTAFRGEDAGVKAFSAHSRIQCKSCKYCVSFGANSEIWNRNGSRNVHDSE